MLRTLGELDARYSAHLRLDQKEHTLRTIAVFFAHSGDSWFCLLGLLLVWLFAPAEWKNRAVLLAMGIVALAVVVMAIKFTVRRKRPSGEWGAIYRNTDPHSFPSGHAARVFLLAVMGLGLGPGWFGAGLLVWAPLVSLARVAMGVHYLLDIVVGMVIGVAAGIIGLVLAPAAMSITPFLFQ